MLGLGFQLGNKSRQQLIYGPELITNGEFNADTDWTLDQWAISNGVLVGSGITAAYKRASQAVSFTIGKTYKISGICTEYGGGSLDYAYIRKPRDITIIDTDNRMDSTGKFEFIITVGSENDALAIANVTSSTDIKIDNLSVKEVL